MILQAVQHNLPIFITIFEHVWSPRSERCSMEINLQQTKLREKNGEFTVLLLYSLGRTSRCNKLENGLIFIH